MGAQYIEVQSRLAGTCRFLWTPQTGRTTLYNAVSDARNMQTATETQISTIRFDSEVPHWSLTTRVAFRFCVLYFGLFSLTTQIIGRLLLNPSYQVPNLGTLPPFRGVIFWIAAHVFGVTTPLVFQGSGGGDKVYDWVWALCRLILAVAGTAIWSLVTRRQSHPGLYKWFRLLIRFALASEMFLYGMDKVIPLQMPFPALTRLVEPYGNFSPMGVLWASIGASPTNEVFAGGAEMLAGLLMIIPRTTVLGALVCLADMTQVFTLNMTYDVPVKILSSHLLLMSAFLLAPDFRRLADFFLRERATDAPAMWPLFRTQRANRIALVAQIVFGAWLLAWNVNNDLNMWYKTGGGRVKPPLYGIWNVEQMSIDGTVRSPLVTDYGRWRRVIFDVPDRVSFQRMDESIANFPASLNASAKTLTLSKTDDKKWKAHFTFARDAQDRMTLDGDMDGHKIDMRLALVDRNGFLLVNRGFSWVQDYPFNR
jgi:uncharacterized membrane protein YphA (DoxX/SURF4 family)